MNAPNCPPQTNSNGHRTRRLSVRMAAAGSTYTLSACRGFPTVICAPQRIHPVVLNVRRPSRQFPPLPPWVTYLRSQNQTRRELSWLVINGTSFPPTPKTFPPSCLTRSLYPRGVPVLHSRGRKIRCDAERPSCKNCVRRREDCKYDAKPKRRGPDKIPGSRMRSCKSKKQAMSKKSPEASSLVTPFFQTQTPLSPPLPVNEG